MVAAVEIVMLTSWDAVQTPLSVATSLAAGFRTVMAAEPFATLPVSVPPYRQRAIMPLSVNSTRASLNVAVPWALPGEAPAIANQAGAAPVTSVALAPIAIPVQVLGVRLGMFPEAPSGAPARITETLERPHVSVPSIDLDVMLPVAVVVL
ncbi:hypothetical protein [Conexibacter woesei]|uniref:hypothetical protein n=1 Tax=Conexibacter woesei TaxID=191495 RepID=UPI0005A15898|nr:hypothetical protein [Conexibacter woesei]